MAAVVPRQMRNIVGINVLWLGLGVVSDGLSVLLLPARISEIAPRAPATIAGLSTFLGLAAGMAAQPLIGAWGDSLRPRWGRRLPIALLVAATAALIVAMSESSGLFLTVTLYVAVIVGANAVQALHQPLLAEVVERRHRGRASGVKGFMDLAGATLAFAVLGSLIERRGVAAAAIAVAGSLVITFALQFVIVRAGPLRSAPPRRRPAIFGIDRRRHAAFVRVVAARFLFLFGIYAVGRFFLFFVAHRLGLPRAAATEEAGYLLGALALVTAVSAIPAGWLADRYGRVRIMTGGAVVSAVGIVGLLFAATTSAILLMGSLMALGSAAFGAANWALAADLAPDGEAGRFLGIANIGTAGAAAAAGLLGPLVDAGEMIGGGFIPLFVVAAAACLASILTLRRLPTEPLTEPDVTSTVSEVKARSEVAP